MALTKSTGTYAIAYGALDAGVQLVTGYPGSPSTGIVDTLAESAGPGLQVFWSSNEKSAFDSAFGASLAGMRSLVCLKSVGLNVALDSLMVGNLAPGDGGFVLLVGDDPGGWGSQNEQDSRPLLAAAEIPVLEPNSAEEARQVVAFAFGLSEEYCVPVAVRFTRALAFAQVSEMRIPIPLEAAMVRSFKRQGERFLVLPIDVVNYHERLIQTLGAARKVFEDSPWNAEYREGKAGVVAVGYTYQKLLGLLESCEAPPIKVMKLATIYPLPVRKISAFLTPLERVLVLEEGLPVVEEQVRAIAHVSGLGLEVLGRASGSVPVAGELFDPEIGAALGQLVPDWHMPEFEAQGRTLPSRQPLCDDCPYVPTFEALLTFMESNGGRDSFVVTGETGCMVRSQLLPWAVLDTKYGMGSSIGLAEGIARAMVKQRVISISGDSAFIHSGFAELIDAVQSGITLTVVILANGTTALSGGQPHPATGYDILHQRRPKVEIEALVRAAGAHHVNIVKPFEPQQLQLALDDTLSQTGISVLIVDEPCPRWLREPFPEPKPDRG